PPRPGGPSREAATEPAEDEGPAGWIAGVAVDPHSRAFAPSTPAASDPILPSWRDPCEGRRRGGADDPAGSWAEASPVDRGWPGPWPCGYCRRAVPRRDVAAEGGPTWSPSSRRPPLMPSIVPSSASAAIPGGPSTSAAWGATSTT